MMKSQPLPGSGMCSSRKYPQPPGETSLEILRGWVVLKAKTLKGKYEDKVEFP